MIDSKSQVYCWGDNSLGQLGLIPSIPYQPTPIQLSLTNVNIDNPPTDIIAASIALGDLYSVLVIRRDKGHFFSKQTRDTTMRPRTLRSRFTRRLWQQPESKQVDNKINPQPQPIPKWSFHINDPVESLEVPSSMDHFLHMMATTKIAKRMPHLSKQASTHVINHKSHAKLATFHLTEATLPEKQQLPTKPVIVKGLTSWRTKHVQPSNNNSTFSHAARFPTKKPPPVEVLAIVPTIPATKKIPRSGVFFGLSQRGQQNQNTTPGPGTYDVIKHYERQPLPAAFNSTTPKDLKFTPRDMHEPTQELHPEKAHTLIFPTPPAVKFDSGQDFSKVVQQHMIQGKGSTPGPGAYTIRL
ncbi:hypothetical protein THRCLA_01033 [Thraustotheca clavata]|uniref:Regulator of chromosome condensation (RCC1) n=1 Tax=Thraustotheca clavata TaxID=74557 RepID=A0A1W0A9R0_9STRA|nr:hypothetical protein THRCLA_01033 [Thraustotheca clavata]